jgi:hypothetical protein
MKMDNLDISCHSISIAVLTAIALTASACGGGSGKVICIVTLGTKTTVGWAADGRAIACRGWHRGCAG